MYSILTLTPTNQKGWGGIRTLGALKHFSFQDWHHKPLGHSTKMKQEGFEPP